MWKRHVPLVVAASVVLASWPLKAAAMDPDVLRLQAARLRAAVAAPQRVELPANGEVIVKFRKGAAGSFSVSAAATVVSQGGAVVTEDQHLRMLVKLPADSAQAGALVAALRDRLDVAYVENNGLMEAYDADPSLSQLWGMTRMNVPAAWAAAPTTGPQVVVAVVDSGVDSTHEDLAGRVLTGFNAIDATQNSMDDEGHGTHVSGTIAATYNNGMGVAGVAGPANVRILPVKVLGADGSGSFYTVAQGIEWAADHGAQIINLSLGGGRSNVVEDAVLYAERKGVVVVAAAGNSNDDTTWYSPASVPGVVTVAALDPLDAPAYFSNYGDQVDLIAPGVGILSTVPGNQYESWNGTSMAAPHVAGLAALLKAAQPTFTRWDIQACLYATATPIAQPAGYGYGVPMADALLACDPTKLSSAYGLKLEGPDPDTDVYGSTAFSFDVKPGGSRLVIKDSKGTVRGSTQLTGAGVATVNANLSGLTLGSTTLKAEVTDGSGKVLAVKDLPVMIEPPATDDIGLAVSPTDFNPAKGKMKITTRLSSGTEYLMAVFNDQDEIVKWLAAPRRYTGAVYWDGKGDNGKMLPEGAYVMVAVTTDETAGGVVDFALRVSPAPGTPTMRVEATAVNVPSVGVSGKVNPKFEVEAQVKAPGSTNFTSIGVLAMAGTDGTFAAPLPLTGGEGTYEVQIRGVDPFDLPNASRWTASAKVLYDATAPTIVLTSPTPYAGVIMTNNTARLGLIGTIEPGATVTASAGTSIKTAVADAKGNWKIDLPISTRTDSLMLSAVDRAGNQAVAQQFGVVVDAWAPIVAPESPTLVADDREIGPTVVNGTYRFATMGAPQYLLVGAVDERIGKVVPSNGKLVANITGDEGSDFTVDLTPALKNGSNALSFDIYDMAGNMLKLSVSVTLDSNKPTVTITEQDRVLAPKPDGTGGLLPVPVTFTVTTSEPLQALEVISDNGGPLGGDLPMTTTESTNRRTWTVKGSLPPADANWTFQFVGTDLAGNVGQLDIKARRQVRVDGTAPALLSLSHSTDTPIFTTASSVTVSGTVADTGAGVKSVTVGKSTAKLTNGSFSVKVSLTEGKLTAIPVVVLDNAGNKRTEIIQVIMKSKINGLTLNTPKLSPGRELTISGKTDAAIVVPQQGTYGLVPVTVVVRDSLTVERGQQVLANPDGSYSVTFGTADWPKGKYTVTVTAGVPQDFAGLAPAFKTKTVTGGGTLN